MKKSLASSNQVVDQNSSDDDIEISINDLFNNQRSDITSDLDTTTADIQQQLNSLPLSRRQKILHTLKIASATTVGMASAYSTFGTVAIYYKNGLWLLGPVGGGGVIGLSDAVVNLLNDKFPNNNLLSRSHSVLQLSKDGGLGFLADYGFTWGLIKSLAILLMDNKNALKDTILYAAPVASFLPALWLRYVRYKQITGNAVDNGFGKFIADLMRGVTAPVGLLGTLGLQGVIAPDSYIPLAVMSAGGFMMCASNLLANKVPGLSKVLMFMVNLLMENPSLAAMFFAFPNDIYASLNDGAIPESFFWTNLGVSSFFLLMMTCLSFGVAMSPEQAQSMIDDEEIAIDEEVSENSLLINVSVAGNNASFFGGPQPQDHVVNISENTNKQFKTINKKR